MLELRDVPKPVPGDGEVLIKVEAAALNSWDWDLLRGGALVRPENPFRPRRAILGADTIAERRTHGPLIISDIVYSEFSVGMDDVDSTDEAIAGLAVERLSFSNAVLFRAGRAYRAYRDKNGEKLNVLSDFLIGAQAEVEEVPLATSNARDFQTYFPALVLIQPNAG